jgi:hypothetical protein
LDEKTTFLKENARQKQRSLPQPVQLPKPTNDKKPLEAKSLREPPKNAGTRSSSIPAKPTAQPARSPAARQEKDDTFAFNHMIDNKNITSFKKFLDYKRAMYVLFIRPHPLKPNDVSLFNILVDSEEYSYIYDALTITKLLNKLSQYDFREVDSNNRSALHSLAKTPNLLLKVFNFAPKFKQAISLDDLTQKSTLKGYETTPFYHLAESNEGLTVLRQLLPNFSQKIDAFIKQLCLPVYKGELFGKFTFLRSILSFSEGMGLLNDLLDNFDKISSQNLEEYVNCLTSLSNHIEKKSTALLHIAIHDQGVAHLGRLIPILNDKNLITDNVINAICVSSLISGPFTMTTLSAFFIFTTMREGLEIIKLLKNKLIHNAEFITALFEKADNGSSAFLNLTSSPEGREVLSLLFKENDKLINQLDLVLLNQSYCTNGKDFSTPLYFLMSSEDGQAILLEWLEQRPDLKTEILHANYVDATQKAIRLDDILDPLYKRGVTKLADKLSEHSKKPEKIVPASYTSPYPFFSLKPVKAEVAAALVNQSDLS